jgi:hypothetical protein
MEATEASLHLFPSPLKEGHYYDSSSFSCWPVFADLFNQPRPDPPNNKNKVSGSSASNQRQGYIGEEIKILEKKYEI